MLINQENTPLLNISAPKTELTVHEPKTDPITRRR